MAEPLTQMVRAKVRDWIEHGIDQPAERGGQVGSMRRE
jgi:hypothetical protein